ncbi:ArsI/CadI family heavy metal resistance metalloenzyme [Amycolatopsis sp. DSM 110486]|uniref:ArsI/CadI family heavy metal resistance metalloenzyme n=1 Tax=Amycolatopsis sp. DSM 110486 TaxID=2865832 RepID=UPI001C69B619|nr:ArsI/CadI family heavy metal resistance metalloenzyme [Amycolatopsis sp. DSM 110486]QYN19651.1 VOC family protein [Amycolatopsis sp. DSM 110486]
MSRVQLALRVGDLEGSIDFYSKLFNTEPAKRRAGYANFAIAEPALKLVLLEGEPGQATVMDHLGVEVESTEEVDAASKRLTGEGMDTLVENGTTCCYALQDKVWVHGPGQEPWEVYTVTGDSASFGQDSPATVTAAACCTPDADTGEVDKDSQPAGCCD